MSRHKWCGELCNETHNTGTETPGNGKFTSVLFSVRGQNEPCKGERCEPTLMMRTQIMKCYISLLDSWNWICSYSTTVSSFSPPLFISAGEGGGADVLFSSFNGFLWEDFPYPNQGSKEEGQGLAVWIKQHRQRGSGGKSICRVVNEVLFRFI